MIINYSSEVQKALKGIRIGDRIRVTKGRASYEGILMPRTEAGDHSAIVVKLANGYNVGIKYTKGVKVRKMAGKKMPKMGKVAEGKNIKFDSRKPVIAVIGTGGTIASRVDYVTGGVVPVSTSKDLVASIPELADIANLRASVLFELLSEDMRPEHWSEIARAIAKEIKKGCDGVILTHGTDTMGYTAAALSFALQDLPVPVLLVGSQRSSDRGSTDAAFNMICAAQFIRNTDFAGVAICMHGSVDDKFCHILPGTKTRKMHTSRRDAFRAINTKPIAKVDVKGSVQFEDDYTKKGKEKLKVADRFEPRVGLIKIHPAIDASTLEPYRKYKGLVLEGTGLGHVPMRGKNRKFFDALKFLAKKMSVVMTSQCIYGGINMNVYSNGRELKKIGVISGKDMLPETAFVKLSWLIGNKKNIKDISKNLVGEISERHELIEEEE